MSFIEPKVTCENYVSYFVSPYNAWFKEWGYPLLDINRYEDGEFEIIQFHSVPLIPAEVQWSRVLMGFRNMEINPWMIKKYTENLDLERRHAWDELEKSEERARQQQLADELHVQDSAMRKFEAIRRNPDLMERIARNGIQEIGLRQLARHIPNHRYRADKKKEVPCITSQLAP